MATYQVTAPDGSKYRITAPEGTTQDQALAEFQRRYEGMKAPAAAAPAAAAPSPEEAYRKQLAADAETIGPLQKMAIGAGGWLSEMGEGAARLMRGGATPEEQARTTEERKAVEALGGWGTAGRVGAEMAATALPVGRAYSLAKTLGQKAAALAGTGALTEGVRATGEGDTALGQAGMGAAGSVLGGAAGGMLTRALGGAVKPLVSKDAEQLLKSGVVPTVGQAVQESGAIGSGIKRLEDALTSTLGVGEIVQGARTRASDDMTRALMKEVLPPGAVALPKAAPERALGEIRRQYTKAYDDLFRGETIVPDQTFQANVTRAMTDPANMLNEVERRAVDKVLSQDVFGQIRNLQPGQAGAGYPGEAINEVKNTLSDQIRRFTGRGEGGQRVADVLTQVREEWRQLAARSLPPEKIQTWRDLDSQYEKYMRLSNAYIKSKGGAHEGRITPKALMSAIEQGERAPGKPRIQQGRAPMQESAERYARVMGDSLGESGTTPRAIAGALTTGGPLAVLAFAPHMALNALGGAALYSSRPVQRALLGDLAGQAKAEEIMAKVLRGTMAPAQFGRDVATGE